MTTFSKRIEKHFVVLSQFVKDRACLKSVFRFQTDAFGVSLFLVVPVIFQLHKIEYEAVDKAGADWHISIVKILLIELVKKYYLLFLCDSFPISFVGLMKDLNFLLLFILKVVQQQE